MQVTVPSNRSKQATPAQVDRYPDECPFCHRAVEPITLSGFHHADKNFLLLSFYCPKTECGRFFLGNYQAGQNRNGMPSFYFKDTVMGDIKQKEHSDIITDISKDFITIYDQARIAEYNNLDQISGVGYRKALEFLIKDYIIAKDNSKKEVVEKAQLGKCINDHIADERIKNIAKRATWLGNDETHYIRKWITKDVTDLKALIDLTVHWIETEAMTERMIASMPE